MFASDKIGCFSDTRSVKAVLCEAILFQSFWFVCVLFDWTVWLPALLIYFGLYLGLFKCRRYSLFLSLVAVLGIMTDFVLCVLNVFSFEPNRFPLWLVALWFVFASSLPIAFSFLRKRLRLASLLGAPGAASSYYLAISLRPDVHFGLGSLAGVIIIALVWSVLFPCFLLILNKLHPEDLPIQPIVR